MVTDNFKTFEFMDSKTYVIGDSQSSGNNVISALAPLLQNRGIDPTILATMNNGGFGNGNGFIWVLFLLALMGGWGNNGWGNNGMNGAGFLSNQLNNDSGRDLLMQAIQGNHDALNQLASTLQVNATAVQNGFSNVMQSLCNIGNQVGQSSLQVINALQNGNMTIAQQIAAASSQSQLSVCQQTNSLQSSICDAKTDIKNALTGLGFQSERQTNTLTQAINASTQRIVDGQVAAEMREQTAIINRQAAEIAQLQATANLAPINTQLAELRLAIANLNGTTYSTKTTTSAS